MSERVQAQVIEPIAGGRSDDEGVKVSDPLGSGGFASAELKQKTARGALVSTVAQVFTFVVRTGSMVVLARLLTPTDFGLMGMVTAFTGFLALFRDVGLSMATVQRDSVSSGQISTLFWVNVAFGTALGCLCVIAAPALVAFYGQPDLFAVTAVLGLGFFFNGLSVQHRALLQRALRFTDLAVIDIVSLSLSVGLGVAMAVAGLGYWSLVASAVTFPAFGGVGAWVRARWMPGLPRRGTGVRSMMWYGGAVTLNNMIVYFAYNVDKVLIGRFWGAETLGIYGRAYQLINLPTENLNSVLGLVAFPALSRIQNNPVALRNYFLKGYSFFLSLVVPITIGCALFSNDIVRVFLGSKWHDAAPVFRLLAPTILVFSLINPLAWVMLAGGHAGRSFRIALVIAPVAILGYLLGLSRGPEGVAAGFSAAMVLLVVPVILWAKRGTLITNGDVLNVVMRPLGAALVGVLIALLARPWWHIIANPFVRLSIASAILFGTYSAVLFFVLGQKDAFLSVLRQTGLRRRDRKGVDENSN